MNKCTSLVLGHGVCSLDDPATMAQMVDKHPEGDGPWPKYVVAAGAAPIDFGNSFYELVSKLDPLVGVGPNGLHAHHIIALQEASSSIPPSPGGDPLNALKELGEIVLSGVVPWVTNAFTEALLDLTQGE